MNHEQNNNNETTDWANTSQWGDRVKFRDEISGIFTNLKDAEDSIRATREALEKGDFKTAKDRISDSRSEMFDAEKDVGDLIEQSGQ